MVELVTVLLLHLTHSALHLDHLHLLLLIGLLKHLGLGQLRLRRSLPLLDLLGVAQHLAFSHRLVQIGLLLLRVAGPGHLLVREGVAELGDPPWPECSKPDIDVFYDVFV